MVSALDVARYLLTLVNQEEGDLMSNLKLQKLLYYVQGHHLALYDEPLFHEAIVAWQYGPVVAEVYELYKGYGQSAIPLPQNTNFDMLLASVTTLINDVYRKYGQYEATTLMRLTHREPPWRNTRSYDVIQHTELKSYFAGQELNHRKNTVDDATASKIITHLLQEYDEAWTRLATL